MNPSNWKLTKEALANAMELEGEDRIAFLSTLSNELRADVERLLAADENADRFINDPVLVELGTVAAESEFDILEGEVIDGYRLIRKIGTGGMGAVFLADHSGEGFSQMVALKLIKRGMDTGVVLKRFLMERRILADLDHPNIARMLDGGSTAEGLPYFVMEYVDGTEIRDYCKEQDLGLNERLVLFRKICDAVASAHQKLVVHRDLKPSNISVTKGGEPKLLDFGIAKLTSPEWDAESNEATITQFRIMTPEYASPEQLAGEPTATSTDIYSLGVVLYELLTGERPHLTRGKTPKEIVESVLSSDPPKPSTVWIERSLSEKNETGYKEADPTSPNPDATRAAPKTVEPDHLRGDLDNIILKAMRREPERRYQSVQEFSDDIRRYLEGLPVTATADSSFYRLKKFTKRHRAGVFAGTLIFLTLLTATAVTAWQSVVAGRERDKAEQRFNQVRKLAKTVLFEYHDGVAKLPGSTSLREKMVQDGLEYLDNLSDENSQDADLQRELAAAYQKIGDVQGGASQANLGKLDDAITSYRKSLDILESLASAEANNSLLVEIAAVHGKLHQLLWNTSQQDEAEKHSYQALTIRKQVAASEPDNLTYQLALARSYRDFGGLLASKTKKDGEGAIAYYQKSNELCDAIIKTDPSNLEARAIAGLGLRRLGAEFEAAEPKTALGYYRKALTLTQEREQLDPKNAQIQIVLADCYSNIGRALMIDGLEQQALENFNLALGIFRGRLELDPNDALTKTSLSQTYNNIGNVLAQSSRFQEALENYKLALNMREVHVQQNPAESAMQGRLGETTFDLGDLYAKMAVQNGKAEHWQEAKTWYQRSFEVWQSLSNNGTLQGYQAKKPEETLKAINKCDSALGQNRKR